MIAQPEDATAADRRLDLIEEMLTGFQIRLDALYREIAHRSPDSAAILAWSNGLGVKFGASFDQVAVCGVEAATIIERADRMALPRVTNGHGQAATLIQRRVALRREARKLNDLIDGLRNELATIHARNAG